MLKQGEGAQEEPQRALDEETQEGPGAQRDSRRR